MLVLLQDPPDLADVGEAAAARTRLSADAKAFGLCEGGRGAFLGGLWGGPSGGWPFWRGSFRRPSGGWPFRRGLRGYFWALLGGLRGAGALGPGGF